MRDMARTLEEHLLSQKNMIDTNISIFEQRRSTLEFESEKLLHPHDRSDAFEAAVYQTKGGGRGRPILFLEFYEALGGDPMRAVESAVGIEELHTASLLQDDSYFMDRGSMRRGKPTARVQYGEATAELATTLTWDVGRHLIMNNAIRHAHTYGYPTDLHGVEGLVSETIRLMVRGQELDLKKDKTPNESDAARLWKNRLFSLATELPVYLLGKGKAYHTPLNRIGITVSEAFQERDDILDVISTAEERGKPTQADEDKHTYVYRKGLDAAVVKYEAGRKKVHADLAQLSQLGVSTDRLAAIVNHVLPETPETYKPARFEALLADYMGHK